MKKDSPIIETRYGTYRVRGETPEEEGELAKGDKKFYEAIYGRLEATPEQARSILDDDLPLPIGERACLEDRVGELTE